MKKRRVANPDERECTACDGKGTLRAYSLCRAIGFIRPDARNVTAAGGLKWLRLADAACQIDSPFE
jgi:hypothetical protein